jgi:8-oxo-dGTP pyrophosphatase MutT (NUDIX family)
VVHIQTKIVVVAVVIDNEGRVLLGKKLPDVGPYPNKWHLPGGKLEQGEELLDESLKREVKEETGLYVLDAKPIFFDEDVTEDKHGVPTHYVFLDYECKVKDSDAVPSADLITLQWFKKCELNELELNKPSIRLFKRLGFLNC